MTNPNEPMTERLTQYWLQRFSLDRSRSMDDRLKEMRHIREEWMRAISDWSVTGRMNPDCPDCFLDGSVSSDASIQVTALDRHRMITRIYDHLFRTAAAWTEECMEMEGIGSAPLSYVCVWFGSGGRKEMTPWSDQDHGVIWEDEHGWLQARVEAYFTVWGETFTSLLTQLGFAPCSGKVLANNRQWQGSITEWKNNTGRWMQERGWENTRYLTMAMDMRAVYGQSELAKRWSHSLELPPSSLRENVASALTANLLHRKRAHNSFGKLIRERYGEEAGRFDVKYRTYVPIAQLARNTSWIVGNTEQGLSTKERLSWLLEHTIEDGALHAAIHEADQAWEAVLECRLKAEGYQEQLQWQSTGMIDPDRLTPALKDSLKASSHAITKWLKWLERRYLHG
ncbi:DUF294 nucleotidyltransferase-like domain-containing protein [Paenibacillus aquistagni]|nr:DUF294 nucleotidyltransferase-like domain-containing protein [Paenibacillus aquistagni]